MPTPSQISNTTAASVDPLEFDDDDHRFKLCGVHCRTMVAFLSFVAIVVVVIVTIGCAAMFRWSLEPLVDVTALVGLVVFFISGVFSHGSIFLALNLQNPTFVQPFLIFHIFLLVVEVTMIFTSISELVTGDEPQLDESDKFARQTLWMMPFAMLSSVLMLFVGIKYKKYLRKRIESAFGFGRRSIAPVLCQNPEIEAGREKGNT